MPFRVIKGELRPDFGRPDGDSMRFVPDDPSPIFELTRRGSAPKINHSNGSIQLRYESVDTMESRAGQLATEATQSNIELANAGGNIPSRAYICSTQLGPNGRPIVFVFTGNTDVDDGGEIFLQPDDIVTSINAQQFARGLAYPLFYDTLFDDLRERCLEISQGARSNGLGVWDQDMTLNGAEWTGSVETLPPIFPKLWRRIDRYVRDETLFDPEAPFRNLKQFIERTGERVNILSEQRFTGFDNIIDTTDTTVRMTVDPHDIVVIS